MIEIEEGRFISRIFYVELDYGGNFLGTLYTSGESWRLTYRLRKYVDNQAFDSEDEKTESMTLEFKPGFDAETILGRCREIVDGMPFAVTKYEVVVDSDQADVVLQKLSEQPWCHLKIQSLDGRPVAEA